MTYTRPSINLFHVLGVIWTLGNLGYFCWYESIGADGSAGMSLAVLAIILAPPGCILVALLRYRAGVVPTFVLQAFATYMLAGVGQADMRGAPQALAFALTLIASPLVLWWAWYYDRLREREDKRYG